MVIAAVMAVTHLHNGASQGEGLGGVPEALEALDDPPSGALLAQYLGPRLGSRKQQHLIRQQLVVEAAGVDCSLDLLPQVQHTVEDLCTGSRPSITYRHLGYCRGDLSAAGGSHYNHGPALGIYYHRRAHAGDRSLAGGHLDEGEARTGAHHVVF